MNERGSNARMGIIIAIVLTTAFWVTILLLTSCKKSDAGGKAFPVTYSCYSEKGKYLLTYMDGAGTWHKDSIYQQTYTKTIDITEDQLFYSAMMDSPQSDSMSIRATYEGKSVADGFRSVSGAFGVTIQLSQAQ